MLRPTVEPVTSSGTNFSLMQRQLALLLHAAKCRRSDANASQCVITQCCVMKQVLHHIENCFHDGGCNEAHCRSSKRVLQHFSRCNEMTCEVCVAVRKPAILTKADPTVLNKEYRNGTISSNNSFVPDITTLNGIKGSPKQEALGASSSNSFGPSTSSSEVIVNGDIAARHGHAKNFHLSDQVRESAMKKFVSVSLSCFPNPNISAYSDPRMKQFLDHVKRIEKDIYMKSKSANDYYVALSNCCQNIHHELKEKHRLRGSQPAETVLGATTVPTIGSEPIAIGSAEDANSSTCPTVSAQDRPPDINSNHVSNQGNSIKPDSIKGSPEPYNSVPTPPTETLKFEDKTSVQIISDTPAASSSTEQENRTPDTPTTSDIKEENTGDSSDGKNGSQNSTPSGPLREPSNRVVWYPNELQRYFLPIVDKISKEKDAEPFLQPVDWEALEIFDYPQVVSHPMDLSTIRNKLENREYKEPWNVVDDFWLMLNNAWLYNKKTSKVYKTCTRLNMEKCKNDRREKEPFLFCRKCGRKWHQVCAIHMDEIWSEGFICKRCTKDHGLKRSENRFAARKLSTCKLSNFLEKRVNDFLKKKCINTGDVIIRVLAAADKTVEVKPGMKSKFCESGELPESFPYRVKAIFAFQEIDGQEVCFFGLHVQEYGSECPYPNTRRVYVAYLDSVYFFRPKEYRTDIYHELLIGYIQYAKCLGFTMAHIWACPPSEGDDYIFHMHPPDQKIPKPKRLQEWYQKMLKKALQEHIVVDYKDICQDAYESGFIAPTELAYFEGDFWPNTLEELIKEMDEQDAKRKREQEALARDDEDDDTKEQTQTRESEKNPGKKKAKKRKLKRNASLSNCSKRKRSSAPGGTDLGEEVAQRVYEIMEKHKENFFVIRLHPQNSVASLGPIRDPDPLVNSDLMECRGAFLERAREKHLEFSSVRRAKYSTLAMLYELHTENRQPLMYTCNACSVQLETPWHCRQCVEYDLCQRCYETERHPHRMVQVGLGLVDGSKVGQDADSGAAAVQESGRDKLSRLVKALSHGCSCRDANCRVYTCKAMKSNVQHFRNHMTADRNNCSVCRSLSFLCWYHSKTCNEIKCPIPLCPKLKAKMKQQQKQQRLEQTQMLRRRMATMQRYNSVTPSHQPTPPSVPSQGQLTSDGVSSPAPNSMQASPAAGPNLSGAPFTGITSPSRTPVSLPSPSPQCQFVHPLNNSSQPLLHSKQLTSNSSSSMLASPPMAAPQQLGPGPPVSYGFTSGSGIPAGNMVQLSDQGPITNYPHHPSLTRSQSVVVSPGSTPNFQSCSRSQQMERSQSAQFLIGMNPSQQPSQVGQSMPRQSPGLGPPYTNAPSSPRFSLQQQPLSQAPYSTPDTVSFNSQSPVPMVPRVNLPDPITNSPYSHSKYPSVLYEQQAGSNSSSQLRHASQPMEHGLASGQNPSFVNATPNPAWRQPGSSGTSVAYPGHQSQPVMTHTQMQPQPMQRSRGPVSVSGTLCAPNVTVARGHVAGSLPVGPGCITPPPPPGVPPEDVHIVKQAYAEMRQRGLPTSEFSNWLSANPHLIRAWQFLQPSLVYVSPQQQSQLPPLQQHQLISQPPMVMSHSTGAPHLNNTIPQSANFSSCQMPIQNSRPLRHSSSSHSQPSTIPIQQPPSQQQWPTSISMPHQPHFRPMNVSPTQQQQYAYYSPVPGPPQVGKFSNPQPPSSSLQTQQPLTNASQTRYMSSSQVIHGQPCSGSIPMIPSSTSASSSVSANLPRGTGGMLLQGPQLQSQLIRSQSMGGPGRSGAPMACAPLSSAGVTSPGMTNPVRINQPAPQYSSVMLSQLLSPGQTPNGLSAPPMPPHYVTHPNQSPHGAYTQQLNRTDFVLPPQSGPMVPSHYSDQNANSSIINSNSNNTNFP